MIEADLNGGFLLPRYAESIYGAHVSEANGGYKVDPCKTEENRNRIKEERAKKAVPVKDWWSKERERVINGDIADTVKAMYRSSMELSAPWAKEFREFWDLPEDFQLP